ncbi:MAG: hypothetical protein SPI65_04510 [Peptoniphilus sp.]|nr:hypothetical protein [Peptoniphilus sp.]MDD7363469.1 hypothetical protein [Bacillota bacterium]MDY6044827.1 hypothetical protein [Peptoniphilus sp.]
MKTGKRIIFLLFMIGFTYFWRRIEPDWSMRVGETNHIFVETWGFKLLYLLILGVIACGFLYEMTRKEKLYWGIGLLAFCLLFVLLATAGNSAALLYIMYRPVCEPPFTFLGALLVTDACVSRLKER